MPEVPGKNDFRLEGTGRWMDDRNGRDGQLVCFIGQFRPRSFARHDTRDHNQDNDEQGDDDAD